jgi:capsular polysaccharide transport system permease protein
LPAFAGVLFMWAPLLLGAGPGVNSTVANYEDTWPSTLGGALLLQVRVVAALVLRETRSRFGHSRLGYLWALIEPVAFVLLWSAMFAVLHRHSPVPGTSLIYWFFTGIIPYLLFSNMRNFMGSAILANRALLFMPLVKPFDAILARSALEILTSFCVGLVLFAALASQGLVDPPRAPMALAGGIAATALLGFGVGLISAVMSALFRSWQSLFNVIMRPQYLLAGVFFDIDRIPSPFRDILLLSPIAHCVMWFRTGFFVDYARDSLDRMYALEWGVGCLILGLALERFMRRRVTSILASG